MRKFIFILLLIYANFLFANPKLNNGICEIYKPNNMNFKAQFQYCLNQATAHTIVFSSPNSKEIIAGNNFQISRDMSIKLSDDTPKGNIEFRNDNIAWAWDKIFKVTASNFTMDGIYINSTVIPVEITATNGADYNFLNVNIEQHGGYIHNGIFIKNAKNVNIENSELKANSVGIKVEKATAVKIKSLTLKYARIGVELTAENIFVENSDITASLDGIGVHEANDVTIKNSKVKALHGGSGMNGTTTAALNFKKVAVVKVLGSRITGSNELAMNSRAIEIGNGKNNNQNLHHTLIDSSCIYGGYMNIGISNLIKRVNIVNSNLSSYYNRGIGLDTKPGVNVENSCFYGNNPLGGSPLFINPFNSFKNNYWEDKGAQNKYSQQQFLESCPPTNNCEFKQFFDASDPGPDTKREIKDKPVNKSFSYVVYSQRSLLEKDWPLKRLIPFTGSLCSYVVDMNTNERISQKQLISPKTFSSHTLENKPTKETDNAKIKMIYSSSRLDLNCDQLEAELKKGNASYSLSTSTFRVYGKKKYKFDAWDTFRDINDRNISTKIANKEFSINIHALNDTNKALQNYKGTICAGVYDSSGLISQKEKIYFDDINTSKVKFNVKKATKNAKIKLFWVDDANTNCPAENSQNQTSSSDNFAIRPNSFKITATNDIISGKDFELKFFANDFKNKPSQAYNESENTSFRLDYNHTKIGCVLGSFTPEIKNFSFIDGTKTLTTRYSDISTLNINISDTNLSCNQKFASIDCKDKNISSHFNTNDISIGKANLQIEPKVARIDANLSLKNFKNGKFTYFANPNTEDVNMSMRANLKAKLKALNYESNELLNFDKNCSAIDGILTLSPKTPAPLNIIIDDNITRVNNTNLAINKEHFTQGKAEFEYKINYARMHDKPVNPYFLEFEPSSTLSFSTITINKNLDGNATFYYGAIKAYDAQTYAKEINSPVEIEVYDKTRGSYTKGANFKENRLYWFRNSYDTNLSSGKVISANDTKINQNLTFINQKLEITPQNKATAGTQDLEIKVKNDTKVLERVLHINNTKWLWHGVNAYNYSLNSTCKEHICVKFDFQKIMANPTKTTNNKQWLESGDIKGSDLEVDDLQQNPTNTRDRGTKVFR